MVFFVIIILRNKKNPLFSKRKVSYQIFLKFKSFAGSAYIIKGVIIMAVEKSMASSSLAEVIDRILDKGIVVDAWVRLSLVGIEFLALETRVVVAGVETYLKYAEAIGLTASAA